jgi:SAM-dependent methyltransferase
VDISPGMVDEYNRKAVNIGVEEKVRAVCLDILAIPTSEIPEELRNVDVVVCSMAFHHIEDISRASKVLASILKKGGYLLVVDLFEGNPFPS